ncbi:L-asparaginase [Sediminitomix flava]|uniref:asparaginase n=2 Tax=Sediminitomix flava TaxID=379075 RepID=A0A315ZCU7_SEDFL|nr:L-asparaginase [Sediminitomix flava]
MSVEYYKTVNINTTKPNSSGTSILIIYTGGTIGMDHDAETGSLVPFDFEKIIDKVPELKRFDLGLTVISFDPLLDSSDVGVNHWAILSRLIEDFYDDYSGFVILHGTDTMAYTASALSFMLENLSKPVILTGGQLPIGSPRTDARENLISALEIASTTDEKGDALVQEVCICFDNKLLRGNRAKKVQNFNFTAFKSYNYPALAEAGIHIEYQRNLLFKQKGIFKICTQMDENVIILKLFPGMTKSYFDALLNTPNLKGVILETFGAGNAPTLPWVTEALKAAVDNDIVVVNISQCTGGMVQQGLYAAGSHLEAIGVVGGGDMTTEAAITKLMYLFAVSKSTEEVKKWMQLSLRGELSDSERFVG